MIRSLVSELTFDTYKEADMEAAERFQELLKRPFMEGVVKGEERSGWIGTIHVGLWPTDNGMEKRYIIHTSFEGNNRQKRNVEGEKILGFLRAKCVMNRIFDSKRTVYTPAIKGHKVVFEDPDKDLRNREIYVNYEPRILAYNEQGIPPKSYAHFLGRDIARFLITGMTNAPRHIRPNFSRESIRKTCMIDIDQYDPRTFNWIINDRFPPESLNQEMQSNHEKVFLKDVSSYFLDEFLPKDLEDYCRVVKKLKTICFDSFVEEIKNVKGSKTGIEIAVCFSVD